MKYRITVIIEDYVRVNDKLELVKVKKIGTCKTWDDVNDFLGYWTEIFGEVTFTIKPITEEEE